MSAAGRKKIRSRPNHAAVNQESYDNPGVWVRVGEYNSRSCANTVAREIDGSYSHGRTTEPYAPVGQYVTELRNTDLYTEIWVKYIGDKELPA